MKKGWGWPANSRKAHYFIDGRAICGKWLFFGAVEDRNHGSPDNCAACKKRLEKERG